jgi:hypothetical protein
MSRKNLTVHYRRLADPTNAFGHLSLEAAVRSAMAQHHDGGPISGDWKRRAWEFPPDNEDTYLLNLHQSGADYFFGDLTLYSRGHMQLLLRQMADAPTLNVEQQPAPAGSEYVHSLMYWMVLGNHAFVIQSHSLTTRHLELYLSWLLKERTRTIGNTGHVQLQAAFDAAQTGGDLDNIREIVVGGPANVPLRAEAADAGAQVQETEEFRALGERRTWRDRAVEVLRAIMSTEADVQHLLESVPEGANLEVSVHIGYKSKKRSISRAPMQQALRNLPDGEIQAIGKDGRVTGQDVRLSHPVSILRQGTMLDVDDVVRALRETYTYFVNNGKIIP